MTSCRYPDPVEPGDTVAVISPAHAPPAGGLERGLDRLESFGVTTERFETATRDTDWLRAHPDERAADVHRAFEDDTIDGVVATFGGNVAHELLDRLDRDVLAANPKRFFGSSDNTHVHTVLTAAGIVSFYGGQLFPDLAADPELHPYTEASVERALRATPFGPIEPADEWTDQFYDLDANAPRLWFESDGWGWREGHGRAIRAPVTGGCLAMLETQLMMGSPYFTEETVDGCVLAIETSGEVPGAHEVARTIAAFGERGFLDRIEALLVGKPPTPGGTADEREDYRTRQREAIADRVDRYTPDLPIAFDLDFGHTAPVLPLPLGATVEVDPSAGTIRFP